MEGLPVIEHPDLLVGKETSDDAGVVRVRPDLALIQTLDFFTPIVNDPEDFGKIAAANSLSDVYAMGGQPLTAMNIVCFPKEDLDKDILKRILLGGLEKIHEAGALLVGGHSVDDPEIKYGLSVTGVVHPDEVITNAGAKPGDRLYLTKPLGTGVLATAIKGGLIPKDVEKAAVDWMVKLNKEAAEAMQEVGVHACTDISGFGLLGHALEMAEASKIAMVICASRVPIIESVLDMARMGMIPAGSFENRNFCASRVKIQEGVDEMVVDIMADAQTSGGLLIAVPENNAALLAKKLEEKGVFHALIGFVKEGSGKGQITVTA